MQSVPQKSQKLGWRNIFASRNWWEFAAAFIKLKAAQPISFLAAFTRASSKYFRSRHGSGRGTCRPGSQELGFLGRTDDARTPGRRRPPRYHSRGCRQRPQVSRGAALPSEPLSAGTGQSCPRLPARHQTRCARTDGVPPTPEQKGEPKNKITFLKTPNNLSQTISPKPSN